MEHINKLYQTAFKNKMRRCSNGAQSGIKEILNNHNTADFYKRQPDYFNLNNQRFNNGKIFSFFIFLNFLSLRRVQPAYNKERTKIKLLLKSQKKPYICSHKIYRDWRQKYNL